MITNYSFIPAEADPLIAARDDVVHGHGLLLDAVAAWEVVMRTTVWDSPTGHRFFSQGGAERESALAMADRAQGWIDEIDVVTAAGAVT